jgi:endonuclease/exonuclease/phosphatase family metal-dependent hydrolase
MIMKVFNKFVNITLLTITILFTLEGVENSVVPQIEYFQNIENLNPGKFSEIQFKEITEALNHKDQKIRYVSYNVLFNIRDDNLDKENRWPSRLPRVVELIKEMNPDIIGVQELYTSQFKDIQPLLNEYEFFASECENGEQNGIFYRRDRFDVLKSEVEYMTTTPNVPSSAILTKLQLKDLKTDRTIAVFNTHLSFSKANKRDFQARFITARVEEIAKEMPVLVSGDMNLFPNRMDLEKLPFYDGDYIHRILTDGVLRDSWECSLLGHLGSISTFTNDPEDVRPFKGLGTPGVILDRIYITKDINVLIHATQVGQVDGHFPSDHMPILIDFVLK